MSAIRMIQIQRAYFQSYQAGDLGSSATALFCAILTEWDRLHCNGPVSWRLDVVCSQSGLTRNTVQKARKRLADAGWIDLKIGEHRKRATTYLPRLPKSFVNIEPQMLSNGCQNLTETSSKRDRNVTETCAKRDRNVVPYTPMPKPDPKPTPMPDDGHVDESMLIDESPFPDYHEAEPSAMVPRGTVLRSEPLSDSQHWQMMRIEEWAVALKSKGCKIGPNNWRNWHRMLNEYGLDVLVDASGKVDPMERWPDNVESKIKEHKPGSDRDSGDHGCDMEIIL